jgi:hypothetical protein
VSTSTGIGPHLFWIVSRGAGTTALVLSSIVLHPSLLDVTVPFAWSYMRLATTLGIVAGWALDHQPSQ